VGLTDAGVRFLEETLDEVIGFAEESLAPLTRQELKTLGALLSKL
jgi:hypothetical protein